MASNSSTDQTGRIFVVDALRGFAIMSIMLLHNLEHFDFYYFPEYFPEWLKALDSIIWQVMFFLFSGKSYAIFAILFGLTFHIMFTNQAAKGSDFRGRFLWRMLLLLMFGMINSIFFEGDILAIYAVLGITLAITAKWSDKAVLIAAILLMIQPLEWYNFFCIPGDPAYVTPPFKSWAYFGRATEYLAGKSFIDAAVGNLINGRIGVLIWSQEAGRYFQTPALFLIGMLLGRKKLFRYSDNSLRFWKNTLLIAVIAFAVLYAFKLSIPQLIEREPLSDKLDFIITSYSNFAFTALLVSGFVLLYRLKAVNKVIKGLEPFGKMSLTNYVTQSLLGSVVYYGFGLGLYKYTGATFSLIIGIFLFLLQLWFCHWWIKSHSRGPLEQLWHNLTWISIRKKR
ncbi:MAG TPA: DUF418 domain-containing protein [Bacteroidales bacterium]|jgi:uncharacterized protein|nr:DUF418 domain-containing protein [Bacteroidales bacterium]